MQSALDTVRGWVKQGLLTVPPRQASHVLMCNPYSLNVSAKAGTLRLPHTFVGNRLRISTIGLLKFLEGRDFEEHGKHEKIPVGFCRDQSEPDPEFDSYPKKRFPTPQTGWLSVR